MQQPRGSQRLDTTGGPGRVHWHAFEQRSCRSCGMYSQPHASSLSLRWHHTTGKSQSAGTGHHASSPCLEQSVPV